MEKLIECSRCYGKGWSWQRSLSDPEEAERDICPDCNGKGKLTKEHHKELYEDFMRGYGDNE